MHSSSRFYDFALHDFAKSELSKIMGTAGHPFDFDPSRAVE